MRFTVVGDLLLDIDQKGTVSKTVPDGPGPVIDVTRSAVRAGGAGLVATLLRLDGHAVTLVGAIGHDHYAEKLRTAMGDLDAELGELAGPTPVKSRVRAGGVTLARLDVGCSWPPAPIRVTDAMLDAIADAEAVIVSDYGRGLTADPGVREALAQAAARVPVVWDPHRRGTDPVPGVAIATPNLAEARGFVGDSESAPDVAGRLLHERWGTMVAVTVGASGVLLCDSSAVVVPAPAVAVPDPCGAGDRLASLVLEGLTAGGSIPDAVATAVELTAEFLAAGGVASLAHRRERQLA